MSNEATKQNEEPSEASAAVAWWRSPREVPGRLRAWLAGNPRRAILVGVACLLSIGGVVTAWLGLVSHARKQERLTLEPALEALDRGAYEEATRLADKYQAEQSEDRGGGADFVRGAAAAYRADASSSELKRSHFFAAAKLLSAASERGWPRSREAEGYYLLGKSLFFSGQLTACRPALREALKLDPRLDSELRYLLAEAYLLDVRPNPALAAEENRIALSERPSLEWQAKLMVQRARILLAQGKTQESLRELDGLPGNAGRSGAALVARGQALLMEAEALRADGKRRDGRELADRKRQEAIKVLQSAQGADTLAADVSRKAMYLMGLGLVQGGDERGATVQFERTRRLFPDTPEATACAFQEAELLRQAGRPDALALYRKVLGAVDPEDYSNPWLPLAELQKKMLAAYQDYSRREDFAACAELASALVPLLPQSQAVELRAENQMGWGRSMISKADAEPQPKAEVLRREARTHFRRAGGYYVEMAELLRTDRRYGDELWNSVQAYFAGRDYHHAVVMLEQYLADETRRRQAEALTLLGEALLAEGRLDAALKALRQCIDLHPRDAAAFRARLLAARVHVEKSEPGPAEALLRENLGADLLTPASVEWRESLFDLASLLYSAGRYEEAIARLDEAAERYPESPRSVEARWLAADACRRWGLDLQRGLHTILVQSTRVEQARQAGDCLERGLARFEKLRDLLVRKQAGGDLTRLEKLVLRNCGFAIGEVLFALARHDEAAKAYSVVVQRDPQSAEALEAYLQIAEAYRRLGRAAEARRAAEQAKVVLGRLKSDAALAETTARDRKQWTELLDGLIQY
jgi:tetratricopeptide (TPR) repeat protein